MPGERRGPEIGASLFRVLSAALLILLCDQVAKHIIQNTLSLGSSTPVIKNIFHLTLVHNRGAAFGILKTQNPLFITIGAAAAVFMAFYLPRIVSRDLSTKIAFALILGGVLGNLFDRIRLGYVIDFLDFRVWPVFNIADSAITIGVLLICILLLKCKVQNSTF